MARLRQVTKFTEQMHLVLGIAAGTLWRGDDAFQGNLDSIVELLSRAPRQLLDWKYSAVYEGARRMLAGVRARHPSLSLAPIIHILVDLVGPPSAEFCRTAANFPQVDDLRFINPWEV